MAGPLVRTVDAGGGGPAVTLAAMATTLAPPPVPEAAGRRFAGAPAASLRVLAVLTVAAAVLRFATLDVQSLWGDESATVLLLRQPLGTMLSHLGSSESTPPLYYVLAWLWTHVFGDGAVGVRSFSALVGVATVPVAWAAARAASERAGLWAAALAAASPLSFYYAQEARAYALLILLAGLGFVAFMRALEAPSRRSLGLWAGVSVLALLTHYFAAFVIAGEALWLMRRHGLRLTALACTPIGVVGLALAPLAARQRSDGKSDWIEGTSLASRLAQAPKQFLVGIDSPAELVAAGLAGLLAVAAIGLVVRRGDRAERRVATLAASVAGVALGLPLLLSLSGAIDLFNGRNVVAAWVPVAALVAVGLGTAAAPRLGAALGTGLVLVMLATIAGILTGPEYQRDDNRGIADALRAPAVARTIVAPVNADLPLHVYLPRVTRLPDRQRTVVTRALAFVNYGQRQTGGPPLAPAWPTRPPAGFRLTRVTHHANYVVALYRAPAPVAVDLRPLRRLAGDGAVAEQQPVG